MIKQLIGLIGFLFLGLSNLSKNRKNIIIFQTISCIFFCIHYFLIGTLTASILNIIGFIKGIMFYSKNETNEKYIAYLIFYILLYLLIGIFTYDNIISIFPIIAYILYTISVFNEKEIIMKFINFSISSMWLIYDIAYHSYAGIISDTLMLITVIIGIYMVKKNTKVLKK